MSNSQYGESGPPQSVPQKKTPSSNSGSYSQTESSGEGDEEQEEPSSSSNNVNENNIEEVLSNFRNLWQKEIANDNEVGLVSANAANSENKNSYHESIEDRAKKLFLLGVENEQKGRLYEAIKFYKKAVQLVPDIEFRLYESSRAPPQASQYLSSDQLGNYPENSEDNPSDKEVGEEQELSVQLQNWLSNAPALCEPEDTQRGTHISSLPMEILLLIFRWVVSRDLDVRSLEMCSMVCRGFYLCARDSEIWRLICLRLWGVNCGGLTNYLTWREMYLERPHLNFSGCYISKTTYVRHGENSFQDQFYRPWHVVEYFRYLRFFPEGRVLMMTTPDKPAPMLAHLKSRQTKYPAIIIGHYRVTDDIVTLVLRRENLGNNNKYKGRHARQNPEHNDQTYNIELQVQPWKGQKNCKLVWTRYKVYSRRGASETVANFEVFNNKFPPFWFSRVKSYCNETEQPLM